MASAVIDWAAREPGSRPTGGLLMASASNPRIYERAIDSVDSTESEKRAELKKQALSKLLDSGLAEECGDERPDRRGPKPLSLNPTVLKPVFIPSSKQHHHRRHLATSVAQDEGVEDSERIAESKALFLAAIQAEKAQDSRGAEERRIAGTPFDIASVDDCDDVDVDEEKEKWQEREMRRIAWETEQLDKWNAGQSEAGRQREMTDEQRLLQDQEKQKEWAERIDKQEEHKFLQKYYHKGAFYQDPSDAIHSRDYSQATGADSGVARDTLPAVLQVRNFGRKGRSKWTHLSAEDTTAFDYGWGDKKNPVNFQPVSRMGGMRGDLENPGAAAAKKRRNE